MSRDLPPWMTGTGCGPNGRAVEARQHEAQWRHSHPHRPTMRTVATAEQARVMRSIGWQLRVLKADHARKLKEAAS